MSLRLRLALWYTALAGVVVGAVLLAAFLSHSATLAFEIDAQLHGVAQRAAHPGASRASAPRIDVTADRLQPVTRLHRRRNLGALFRPHRARTGRVGQCRRAARPVRAVSPQTAGASTWTGRMAGERLRGYIQPVRRGYRAEPAI